MCGIVGYVGVREAAPILLDGLSRLEYRGYDSAGMAVFGGNGEIGMIKTAGRLKALEQATNAGKALPGGCGIGHTRWATHGAPSETNAHPHASPKRRVVLVHNGIIENSHALREQLEREGYTFRSQTDTEAAALLLDSCYMEVKALTPEQRALQAIRDMMVKLQGSFALGILFGDQPGAIYAVRRDSPLVIGRCEEEGHMLASDVTAMLRYTRQAVYLDDMEIARLDRDGMRVYNISGEEVKKQPTKIHWEVKAAEKGGYAHFMLKEIMEQPQAVCDTLAAHIQPDASGAYRLDLSQTGLTVQALRETKRILLLGCGSAAHAALAAKPVIEQLAKTPCECELASEFRYRVLMPDKDALAVIISQSGETADSLAALRRCKKQGMKTLAIVNVIGSAIAREADAVLYTLAGPEISVATTKAYAAQLAALDLLAIAMGEAHGEIEREEGQRLLKALMALPEKIGQAISCREDIRAFADRVGDGRDAFYIGRGMDYAICMEGSLKLKEISYIHAEAYPAGELKHGTISLIEAGVPVIGVATQARLLEKMYANMAEVRARGGIMLALVMEGLTEPGDAADFTLCLPKTDALFAASIAAPPLQLLAYEAACARGLDVDKPRNLAKSVTVE